MERAVGVIAEFNPFHNGHGALLQSIRRRFPEKGILCVMSGNFVQRGEFALLEKYRRAHLAVLGGADLVLELIPPYSILSAEAFAAAAVHVISSVGLCDTLAFGSEIPDGAELSRMAERLGDPSFDREMQDYLSAHRDCGYPAARAAVYEARFGACPALSLPNASLALEYLMAVKGEGLPLTCVPFPRVGGEGIASATQLRSVVREGRGAETAPFLSQEAFKSFSDSPMAAMPLEEVLLYLLRATPREELASYYGMPAIADRAAALARDCASAQEVFAGLRAAHLTDSRIRRSLLALLLKVPRGIENTRPPYTLVLAANDRGRKMLRSLDEGVTVLTKPARMLDHPSAAVRAAGERAAFADALYAQAQGQPGGAFLRRGPVMV